MGILTIIGVFIFVDSRYHFYAKKKKKKKNPWGKYDLILIPGNENMLYITCLLI